MRSGVSFLDQEDQSPTMLKHLDQEPNKSNDK